MKKLFPLVVMVLAMIGCSEDRSHILKVYNWADYIDEDLIGEFETWYEEETGESVEIIYQTFDINETMLSKIELGHEDYDVVCPSDYIIERMLKNDLLLPLERDFGTTPDYIGNVAPFIKEKFEEIEGHGKDANDYSVAYMWGTVGLIYNPKYISSYIQRNLLQDFIIFHNQYHFNTTLLTAGVPGFLTKSPSFSRNSFILCFSTSL